MAGLGGVARNLFGLIVNRVELAALELSAVRTNLLKLLLVAALGIVTAWFAIAYWTALVVYLCWDALGGNILLIMAAFFSILTLAVVCYARSLLANGKLSMPATLAELRNDRDALL
ncbi:MAG: phage holin family protein [Herminiimonas sp.]|nr:phage holin family protein [Herminiimonas sp.]